MLKALLRKEFLELFSSLVTDRKTGKRRSKTGVILMLVLFAFLFGFLAFSLFEVAFLLASALVPVGMSWLFFAVMSAIALFLGVFGSVFNTYAGLYHAKDNELLLSMPIPSSMILFSRLLGVYVLGFLTEALVMIPTLIAYFIAGVPNVVAGVFSVLLLFVLSGLILAITCLFGWLIALISSRLKNKSLITVLLSVGFIVVYYIVYFNLMPRLTTIAENYLSFGESVRNAAYPLYLIGKAAEGEVLPMLLVTAFCLLAAFLTCLILAKSFRSIALGQKAGKKEVYREKEEKALPLDRALIRREWKRFLASPTYMLNCALGTILMPAAAVAAVIFRGQLAPVFDIFSEVEAFLPLLVVPAVCLLESMNCTTYPSVSLEGKTLWLLRSMPIPTEKIFRAKILLQLQLTLPCSTLLVIALEWVLGADPLLALLGVLFCAGFCLCDALIGLALNLRYPILHWTNETIPVKQSFVGPIVMLGGMAASILCAAAVYFLLPYFGAYLLLVSGILLTALTAFFLFRSLKNGGKMRFEKLS